MEYFRATDPVKEAANYNHLHTPFEEIQMIILQQQQLGQQY